MPRGAPPAARRAILLAAAALVALGTIAYAFATRGPIESAEAPLTADGTRVAEAEVDASDCLQVDVRALERLQAALALGCADADDAGQGAPGDPLPAPTAAPTTRPTNTPTSGAGPGPAPPAVPSPGPTPAPSPTSPSAEDAGDAGAPAAGWPTPFLTPVSAPPVSDGDDGIPFPAGDAADADPKAPTGDAGGLWWLLPTPTPTDAPWPEAMYDALTPFLSPPDAARPPSGEIGVEPDPSDDCERVCDPRALGGSGAHPLAGGRVAGAPARVGLLARALDALDAYVRLRA